MRAVAVMSLAALVQCCRPPPPPPPGETCHDACQRQRQLECPGATDTPEGATCEDVCDNAQASGYVRLNLKCRATAPSCAAADLCEEAEPTE